MPGKVIDVAILMMINKSDMISNYAQVIGDPRNFKQDGLLFVPSNSRMAIAWCVIALDSAEMLGVFCCFLIFLLHYTEGAFSDPQQSRISQS